MRMKPSNPVRLDTMHGQIVVPAKALADASRTIEEAAVMTSLPIRKGLICPLRIGCSRSQT
jgi:hypothetical protein